MVRPVGLPRRVRALRAPAGLRIAGCVKYDGTGRSLTVAALKAIENKRFSALIRSYERAILRALRNEEMANAAIISAVTVVRITRIRSVNDSAWLVWR